MDWFIISIHYVQLLKKKSEYFENMNQLKVSHQIVIIHVGKQI